jgi:hypothetical protein
MLIQEGLTKQGPIEQLQVGHVSPFGTYLLILLHSDCSIVAVVIVFILIAYIFCWAGYSWHAESYVQRHSAQAVVH